MGADLGALARAVVKVRGDLRVSQRDLAGLADVSLETVQAIEKSRRSTFRPKTKAKFEDALGKERGWFDYVLENGHEPASAPSREVNTLVPTRERIGSMSRDQILAVADLIREATGSMARAVEFINGAEQVKAELKGSQSSKTG